MKKPTYLKTGFLILSLLLGFLSFAQNLVPFVPRYDEAIKGDMLLIGNSNLGVHPTNPYSGTNNNESSTNRDRMVYVDIDSDSNTFNSSSADLDVPNNVNCYKIVYAGLYWSAVVKGNTPMANIKFKTPGSSNYIDITGTEIYYQNSTDNRNSNTFAYYKDVTSILTALSNPEGTYTVANISSNTSSMMTTGRNTEGLSAGWSLFVIYEDPLLPSKYITSFDGFTKIDNVAPNNQQSFNISGFKTIPVGPVRAKYAFSALEGDRSWTQDYLEINGTKISATTSTGTTIRPNNNFFNSTVSIIDPLTNAPVLFTDRNPSSANTLGFDAGIINIPNAGNSLIHNGDTSATIKLGTNTDIYYFYFSAFAIEIIAPKIILTKIVEDTAGNNIGGTLVNLGDELNYVIGFQNTGNDDATDLTIRDILPTNIVFNYPADIVSLPSGVTVQSYNPATREIVFRVNRSVVEENDPLLEIRFKVTVVKTCSLLSDACSNIITNQAYATYKGTINPTFTISDDPSFSTNTGCLLTPGATNFLADINCSFNEDVILCGASTVLTAGNGYDSYSWSTSPTGTPVIGTTQSITVTSIGTYYVRNTATAPCQSTNQVFNVITYGVNSTNPVIPFADEVVTCPNDGKKLPNIFLCGANDARFIQTNITDTSSIIWEKLNEASCSAVAVEDCANEDAACTWNQVATGPNYNADTAGQYRLTLNYTGGCFSQYYFNVYENLLIPTATTRDIYCTTPGQITVGGVPSGYEFSIDGVNYQPSNVFSITTPGIYSIYVKQIGVTPNPCIFSVPDVQIRQRDFTVSTSITQPLCHDEKGSVKLAANDVRPQYFFSISQGATLINSVGPIMESDYTFANLNPGTYSATISTEDGCTETVTFDIINPPLLTATSAITKPLTCTDGEITVYPVGGTPPYYYFVNSTTDFQATPVITVATAGIYNITVVDSNNCSAETSITVAAIPAPNFNVSQSNILCTNANDGTISINVTNANGNSLLYSIDNGVTFVNSPVFTGLTPGNYNVVVQYTYGTDVCLSLPQPITITEAPAITGVATLTTPYTCVTNGVITVSGVTGGTAPYTYSIDSVNFQAGSTFSGLVNGTYTVTIKDASNCFVSAASITIDPLNPITDLSFTNTPVTCPSITSNVTLTATGGVGTLQYQIIAPASAVTAYQNSNVFSGLAPNTYTFQVKDANDCIYSESFTIAPLVPITVNTVLTKDLDCTASPDALISGAISGGAAPFSYALSINGAAYTSLGTTGTPFTYTAASAGTYQFRITDANGCTAETSVQTVNAISLPEISVSQTQFISCNGYNNGAIQVTINNAVGTPPFAINVTNTTTGTNYGTQTSGLPAGNYVVTITDAKACTNAVPATITIAEPIAIDFDLTKVDITCNNPGGSSLGSITIENVSGGTAPFTYFITNNFGDVIPGNPYSAVSNENHTFNIINYGIYTVNVVDSNGCSFSKKITMASPPSDLLIDVVTVVPDCTSGGTATVQAISAVGSGSYEFGILEFNTSPYTTTFLTPDTPGGDTKTFTNLTPGVVYTFVVHDLVTDCYYVKAADAAIAPASTLTSTVVPNNVICQGSNNGSVTFTIANFDSTTTSVDYGIYTAFTNVLVGSITNIPVVFGTPSTVTTPAPGTLAPGQYYVAFTENGTGSFNGCKSASTIFEIRESVVDLSITAFVTKNANCNPNSGVITAIAKDGTAPYTYQLTTSAVAPLASDPAWASANVFNQDAGSYYVHVKDAYGCIKSTPVLVISSDPIPTITASTSNQCTVTEGNFSIDVALATPGMSPHSYSINGGAFQTRVAPFTISNLSSGTHTIEVKDANGCGNVVVVTIEAPLGLMPTVSTMPTCNDDDGIITLAGSGGSGSYIYTINSSAPSISISGNVISGVPSGTYTVTITDAITTCTETVSIVLPSATKPIITTAAPTAVTCFGANNGTFQLNVSAYVGPYTYQIFDHLGTPVATGTGNTTASNPQTITGLFAGNYTVLVTETASPFCSNTSNIITIASPIAPLTLTALETSSVTCDDGKGTITAVATGGWGTYEYELTGAATVAFSSNGTFRNLSAGNYIVNVKDALNCTAFSPVTLTIPPPITATVNANTTLLSCFGDTNASITASLVSGGQGSNYSYTLQMLAPTVTSSGPQASPVFSGLGAGTYQVVVNDGYNCEFISAVIAIAEPTKVQASLVKATSQTCTTGSQLTLSATGGTGIYEYSTNATFMPSLGTFAASVTITIPQGVSGTYQYYIRDANGCTANVSNEITIDPLPALVVNLDVTNAKINCAGDATGVIVATAQGGLGSYVYTLQDASGTDIPGAIQNSPGVFTALAVGTYQVKVDSGDCLTTSAQVPILQPLTALTAIFTPTNITCPGTNNGKLEITATGGTGIIKYAISPRLDQFFNTSTFENLSPGTYQAIAQDELGCFELFDFVIDEPLPVVLTIVPGSIIPEVCEGDKDGEFSISISGGTAPYSVALDDVNEPYTTGILANTPFDFTNLSGGDHIIFIKDALDCESEWNITFPKSVLIEPEVVVEFGCSNNLTSNTVTVTVGSSITNLPDLDYSLDGGTYQSSNIFNDVPAGLNHTITVRHTNGCEKPTLPFDIAPYTPLAIALQDGGINEIVAVTTGGSGTYEYSLNGVSNGSSNTFIIYESGNYTVTVTDSYGCYATASKYFEYIDVCIPNYFTPNDDGKQEVWEPGCVTQYKDMTFDIFDRYGRMIATLKIGGYWDGTYNGVALPTGDYWYVVRLNDKKDKREFVGHFTLYR